VKGTALQAADKLLSATDSYQGAASAAPKTIEIRAGFSPAVLCIEQIDSFSNLFSRAFQMDLLSKCEERAATRAALLPPVLDHHQVAGLFIDLREKHPLAIPGDRHRANPTRRRPFQLIYATHFLRRKIEELDRVFSSGMAHIVDARSYRKPLFSYVAHLWDAFR
jgi:hypothetical protein